MKLKSFIKEYKENWLDINRREIYKWKAIKQFQDNFFNKEVPFKDRIKVAFSKHKNLLVYRDKYLPLGMLNDVANVRSEDVERFFNALFDESTNLKTRVETYMSDFENIVKQLKKIKYKGWNKQENLKTYQNTHAISVYLAMRHPRSYYIYQSGVFNKFSKVVGYKIKHGINEDVERYLEFNDLCEVVKKALLKEKGFISYYDGWLKDNNFDDANYNLLTQDFIYAVGAYLNNIPTEQESDEEIEASEFQSVSKKIARTFKAVKNKDYAKNDEKFRDLGKRGEEWVMAYEKERLKKLGIKHKVKHTSVEEGDGKGYDIKSVEDDGKTPRYIEVKTTTGCVGQPFYYSDNELQFSVQNKKHYYVYRVYNFKGESKKADLLRIHGSMKDLKGKPISYKVSVKK